MKVFYGASIVKAGYQPFLQRILEVGFRQRLDPGGMLESEILVEEMGDQMRYIYLKPWNYSFLVSGEPFHHDSKPYTMVFCGNDEQIDGKKSKCILFPLYYFETKLGKSLDTLRPWSGEVPSKFACAFVSNPLNKFRNRFLHVLRSMKLVDSFGLVENSFDGKRFEGDTIEKMKEYKFNICFENAAHTMYITEKLLKPVEAGIVPVYWGCPAIADHFNTERFLWIKDESDEAIVNAIHTMIAISKSPELWLSIVAQPIWAKGAPPITVETMGNQVNSYLQENYGRNFQA